MKRALAVLMLLVGMSPAIAEDGRNRANLKLELNQYRGYTLKINGAVYRQTGNTLWLKDLRSGNNRIEILERRGNNGNQYGNRNNGHRGGNNGNRNGHNGNRAIVSGNIYLAPGATTFAVIGRNRRIQIRDVAYHGYNSGHGHGHRNGCIDDYSFRIVLDDMHHAHFEGDRMRVAKNALRHNRLSSYMVMQMMRVLSFEGSRLDLAKFAYQHVIDPQQFYQVNDAFRFDSSIRELDRYIRIHCH